MHAAGPVAKANCRIIQQTTGKTILSENTGPKCFQPMQAKKHDLFLFQMWEEMGAKYGKVFKWFWATQPVITIRGGRRVGSVGSV
jgi:hypothetical protein